MDSCYDLSIVYIHCMHYIILYMSVSNVYTSEGIDCKYPCEMDVRVKGASARSVEALKAFIHEHRKVTSESSRVHHGFSKG